MGEMRAVRTFVVVIAGLVLTACASGGSGPAPTSSPATAAVASASSSAAGASTPASPSGSSVVPGWQSLAGAPADAGIPARPCSAVSTAYLRDVAPDADPAAVKGSESSGLVHKGVWGATCTLPGGAGLLGFLYYQDSAEVTAGPAWKPCLTDSHHFDAPGATATCLDLINSVYTALAMSPHRVLTLLVTSPDATPDAITAEMTRLWTAWSPRT